MQEKWTQDATSGFEPTDLLISHFQVARFARGSETGARTGYLGFVVGGGAGGAGGM
jgi:hypothetical protein